MREGWEIKKLGDLCILFTDGDWIESKDQSIEGIRLIQTGNVGCGIFNDKTEHYRYISQDTFNRLKCKEIYAGDILISRLPDPIGRACIIPQLPDRMITAVDCTIVRLNENIKPQFLVYYTNSRVYNREIQRYIAGAVRKRISRKNLSQIDIPVPPLAEQERIVGELDLLSGVIAKKREQLTQLDALAQSIFYTMFGDPISNEKGWNIKTLDSYCKLKAGKGIKASELYDKAEINLYPCYGGNGIRGYINKFSHQGVFPIMGRQGALCGNVVLAHGKFYATEHAVVVSPTNNNKISSVWLWYTLSLMNLNRYAQGVAQPGLAVNVLNKIHIIMPCLSLQQQFAEKIDAIEKQKERIRQSLTEVQQLFDSRMDFYFN